VSFSFKVIPNNSGANFYLYLRHSTAKFPFNTGTFNWPHNAYYVHQLSNKDTIKD